MNGGNKINKLYAESRRKEGYYNMNKKYKTMQNVGKVKYLVSFHDGEKTHKDGSEFFDIRTFTNKISFNKFVKELQTNGYVPCSIF